VFSVLFLWALPDTKKDDHDDDDNLEQSIACLKIWRIAVD